MRSIVKRYLFLFTFVLPAVAFGQKSATSFRIVPLGVLGGIDESNLSAYMLAPKGSNNYICLDAGTLHAGISKAVQSKAFTISGQKVLQRYVKGYLISHAHLDHLAGLIINSPEDSAKTVYGLASTLETIKTHYFTWESWANFADDGEKPQLRKYHYGALEPGAVTPIANTELQVTAFPLSHANLTSTAFLVQHNDAYVLYLGDTGADELEKSQNLHKLWEAVAPLIKQGKLKALMIEVSFPNDSRIKAFLAILPHVC